MHEIGNFSGYCCPLVIQCVLHGFFGLNGGQGSVSQLSFICKKIHGARISLHCEAPVFSHDISLVSEEPTRAMYGLIFFPL